MKKDYLKIELLESKFKTIINPRKLIITQLTRGFVEANKVKGYNQIITL